MKDKIKVTAKLVCWKLNRLNVFISLIINFCRTIESLIDILIRSLIKRRI